MAPQLPQDADLALAYRAAILLTANARFAEKAVMCAIESMNRETATGEDLLGMTVTASIQIMTSAEYSKIIASEVSFLPAELRQVLQLPARLRQAFVLRVLLAMPRELSAQLLDMDPVELDRSTGLAAKTLADLCCSEGQEERSQVV